MSYLSRRLGQRGGASPGYTASPGHAPRHVHAMEGSPVSGAPLPLLAPPPRRRVHFSRVGEPKAVRDNQRKKCPSFATRPPAPEARQRRRLCLQLRMASEVSHAQPADRSLEVPLPCRSTDSGPRRLSSLVRNRLAADSCRISSGSVVLGNVLTERAQAPVIYAAVDEKNIEGVCRWEAAYKIVRRLCYKQREIARNRRSISRATEGQARGAPPASGVMSRSACSSRWSGLRTAIL